MRRHDSHHSIYAKCFGFLVGHLGPKIAGRWTAELFYPLTGQPRLISLNGKRGVKLTILANSRSYFVWGQAWGVIIQSLYPFQESLIR